MRLLLLLIAALLAGCASTAPPEAPSPPPPAPVAPKIGDFHASPPAVILGASLVGGPVSTTQVVSGSILGAGAAERKSKGHWTVLGEIATAWLLTLPATALVAVPLYWLIEALLRAAGVALR